ncbi:MAG: AbrB/MazE/SpoVT family DNA-binding domain-containing protein [Clostridia bacterium]|nr:AbrB/MazE/SpoVT family DNA-binding domain-containing protein [Clostridia bacterium]
MKATGIVRRIDDLGRVVIPKEIRRTMRIREGDPLEIYTDREGEVIFKKYSPIGELSAFAGQYAETLNKTCRLSVVISDRDAIIAAAGLSKREFMDKKLTGEAEQIVESRAFYEYAQGQDRVAVTDDGMAWYVSCAMPIVTEGDVVGCVFSLAGGSDLSSERPAPDVEHKLIQTAAVFLSHQIDP